MEKYETEFKLKVVKSFLAGEGGAKLLARRWSVPEEKIRTWVSHYRLHGIAGLRPKRGSYTAHFKCWRRPRIDPLIRVGGADKNLVWFYAASPRLTLYSIGLRAPREILIRFSLYQRMYESTISMNCSMVVPFQSRG